MSGIGGFAIDTIQNMLDEEFIRRSFNLNSAIIAVAERLQSPESDIGWWETQVRYQANHPELFANGSKSHYEDLKASTLEAIRRAERRYK